MTNSLKPMKLKIEKGIPLPDHMQSMRGRRRLYDFHKMAKNDSFAFGLNRMKSVRMGVYHWMLKNKKKVKFIVAKVSKNKGRCWRIV